MDTRTKQRSIEIAKPNICHQPNRLVKPTPTSSACGCPPCFALRRGLPRALGVLSFCSPKGSALSNVVIHIPQTDAELEACFGAFAVLRPHLTVAQFLPQVRRQELQGYKIAAIKDAEQVVSAAGFRFCEFLAWGRVLYIDDLTTLPSARGKGYAGTLLDWLTEQAAQEGCDAVHLDTGYTRHAAHRLYLSKGFEMTSHHMAKLIAKG